MDMNISTTRFAAVQPAAVAEVDFASSQRQKNLTHTAVAEQIHAQKFAADYAAHVASAESRLRLNRLA